jgi:hypothetical protein
MLDIALVNPTPMSFHRSPRFLAAGCLDAGVTAAAFGGTNAADLPLIRAFATGISLRKTGYIAGFES